MRAVCLASVGAAVSLAVPGPAAADPLPPLAPPPDIGTAIEDALGSLGSGSEAPPGGSSGGDSTAGGSSGGSSSTTTPGDSATATTTTAPAGGTAVADTRAPAVKLRVVSSYAWVARTGRLKARVTSDERGAVAVDGRLRVSRKLLKLRATVVAFPAAGTRVVTIRVPRAALRRLARARTARLSLRVVAVDLARNQATTRVKRTLTRPRKVAQLRRGTRTGARRAVDSRG